MILLVKSDGGSNQPSAPTTTRVEITQNRAVGVCFKYPNMFSLLTIAHWRERFSYI